MSEDPGLCSNRLEKGVLDKRATTKVTNDIGKCCKIPPGWSISGGNEEIQCALPPQRHTRRSHKSARHPQVFDELDSQPLIILAIDSSDWVIITSQDESTLFTIYHCFNNYSEERLQASKLSGSLAVGHPFRTHQLSCGFFCSRVRQWDPSLMCYADCSVRIVL